MKKFLSKVLTLALTCAIVVTGTSITSEAKGSEKAVATTYSSNAVINDFVATGLKSNGLTIGGKSYNSQQALDLGFAADPAVTTSPMYDYDYDNRSCGFYLYSDGLTGRRNYDAVGFAPTIYFSRIFEEDLVYMKAYGYTAYSDDVILNTDGVWNTDAFIANGINTQYVCAWMQSRGLNTATDVYNYLVANGATFTEKPINDVGDNPNLAEHLFVCDQCPELEYRIDTATGDADLDYFNENQSSGVNGFGVSSYTRDGRTTTNWGSGLRY